ncbi:MAG TPA: ABC transporter permease [Acidimicrobiales bacterium]|nr:ABC transporter permease [Acidimicrobiales bacterium]
MQGRLSPATAGDGVDGLTRSDVVTVISPRVSVSRRVANIWRYRELLVGLVRKDLKVKYKNSVLGFVWSMLNPALTLGIYYFVFQVVLGSGIRDFAVFLMSGLLAYNLFRDATMGATGAMVANAGIVRKVAFPREILALASVGSGLVFFFFQALVLVIILAAARYVPGLGFLPQLIPALVALIVFSSALAVLLAAVNVYFRDTQHLVEIVVGTAWFWATPIVYSYESIARRLAQHHLPTWLPLINPVTDVVLVFQRAIYGQVYGGAPSGSSLRPGSALQSSAQMLPATGEWWYLWHALVVLGFGLVLFVVALVVFGRLEGNFAEEL